MLTKLHLLQVENQLENNNQKVTLRRMRKMVCIKSALRVTNKIAGTLLRSPMKRLEHFPQFSYVIDFHASLHRYCREQVDRIYARHAISIEEASERKL